ncbi:MAG: addiction module protein [Planctomycetales bacterium]|nr:addiction module protein [Planctomycetales bacterium]
MNEIHPFDDAETEIQRAWEAGLERRWEEMESDRVVGKPAESVFAELRKKYP